MDASAFIDRILTEDRQAPVKQRHTSRRIWQRLCVELPGFRGSERTVRGYVYQQRRQLGLGEHEVFIPQSYDWGVEAQVDWYESYAHLDGERTKLQVFEMRSMAGAGACDGFHDLQQISRRSGEAVEHAVELWPVPVRARDLLAKDARTARPFKRFELNRQFLIFS